jgi:hypothetical protein
MKRRQVPNLYFTINSSEPEFNFDIIQHDEKIQFLILSNVVFGIEEAIKLKKEEATIVELNSSGNYVSLHKENWKTSLESAERWFLKFEDYESCAKIKNIIDNIDSYGQQRRLHRKTSRSDK